MGSAVVCFLVPQVSVQLFAMHRTYHEGQLTKRKDRLVANRRLAERALGLGLDRHLRLVPFSVPAWLDPEPLRVGAGWGTLLANVLRGWGWTGTSGLYPF